MSLKWYGKQAPKHNNKTLLLSKYMLPGQLPPPPQVRAWEYSVSDGEWAASMLGNDQVGNCVEAMILHYIMAMSAANDKPITFTSEQAIQLYSDITGYVPGDESTDNGTAITDALAYWQKNGIYGDKILAWAAIPFSDIQAIKQAIAIFGGALIGTAVTPSMEQQFNAGQPWNPPYSGGVIGGHGIPLLGYGREGQTCITWAARQQMSPAIAAQQFDEAYVVISDSFLRGGVAPNHLNVSALTTDINLLRAAA